VVVSKFVPGFSTVAPPIAGALSMRIGAFVVASTASAALWAGAAMLAGMLFAHEIDALLGWMAVHLSVAGFAVGSVVGVYAALKAWQRVRMARLLAGSMITVDELRARLADEPPPFVIDVGSSLAQRSRPHIPGAALLDLDALARCDDFPRDRDIVVYCACPNEASARRGAQILLGKGYRRVRPLEGGIDAWTQAGHPVAHHVPVTLARPGTGSARPAAVVEGDASVAKPARGTATL
jgi:rhodanese-related sulfurtransferase